MISKYIPPDAQRLNLALTNKDLYRALGPSLIGDNVRAFLWADPSLHPSALLCALERDDPDLMGRILDSVDLSAEDARAVLSPGGATPAAARWSPLDEFVDYALTLCFHNKSYRCLRALVAGLPAVRRALAADPDRWRAYVDHECEISLYFSGFIT